MLRQAIKAKIKTDTGSLGYSEYLSGVIYKYSRLLVKHNVELKDVNWKTSISNEFLKAKICIASFVHLDASTFPQDKQYHKELRIVTVEDDLLSADDFIAQVRLETTKLVTEKRNKGVGIVGPIPRWYGEKEIDPNYSSPTTMFPDFNTRNIRSNVKYSFHETVHGILPFIEYTDNDGNTVIRYTENVYKELRAEINKPIPDIQEIGVVTFSIEDLSDI